MTDDPQKNEFNFELFLSVLNHLGRNLYRNFVTVLGEAISNSWDADAKNVWINIDRETSSFSIKDDGVGMSAEVFQNKFLKIGYSRRKDDQRRSPHDRPFIGAKGIGNLALLSCADRISVFTRKSGAPYIGGVIDNADLDRAITDDMTPQHYALEQLNFELISELSNDHEHGTIIVFEDMKEQMKNSEAFIRKLLAMSFKFSLHDPNFTIHVNGKAVSISDLSDLAGKTEFCWLVNKYGDSFTESLTNLKADAIQVTTDLPVSGFLATVIKPRDAKINSTDERASVDLFVNGRLREKNILRHIPTQRILESYLYGQIHYDSMDRIGADPFTSSREGIVETDYSLNQLVQYLKKDLIPRILDEWDDLRLSRGEEGDDENTNRLTKKMRKAKALVSAAEEDYAPKPCTPQRHEVDDWIMALRPDAEFNVSAYFDCFLSKNLVRAFINNQGITLTQPAIGQVTQWKEKEEKNLEDANISFKITKSTDDLGYLNMKSLSILSEGGKQLDGKPTPLCRSEVVYTPIKNAVGHTSLLTPLTKQQLEVTFENIKGRLKKLLEKVKP